MTNVPPDCVLMPCLICDGEALVKRKDMEGMEAPAAFCDGCLLLVDSGRIPWPEVKMIYMLRCMLAQVISRVQMLEAAMSNF